MSTCTWVRLWGEAVDEQDVRALEELLAWVLERVKPEEVVSYVGTAYPKELEGASIRREHLLDHRLCTARFRRNKIARLRRLERQAMKKGWGLMVMELRAMESLLRSPSEVWGGFAWRLLRMMQMEEPSGGGEKVSWAYRYRRLLLELGRNFPRSRGLRIIGRSSW